MLKNVGMHIIFFTFIRNGRLESIIEQSVPLLEVSPAPSKWFVVIDKEGNIGSFDDKSQAMKSLANFKGMVINVKANKIIQKTGDKSLDEKCQRKAVKEGYFIESKHDTGNLMDIVRMFKTYFERDDSILFFTSLILLIISCYLNAHSDLLSGSVISIFCMHKILEI